MGDTPGSRQAPTAPRGQAEPEPGSEVALEQGHPLCLLGEWGGAQWHYSRVSGGFPNSGGLGWAGDILPRME